MSINVVDIDILLCIPSVVFFLCFLNVIPRHPVIPNEVNGVWMVGFGGPDIEP